MNNQKLFISATLEEVAQTLGKILEEYLRNNIQFQPKVQQSSEDRILSRKETAELLKITLPTFHACGHKEVCFILIKLKIAAAFII